MIGHLGSRVSDLLDGQLPPEEEERAWAHVYACHHCRDLVEREGWVKTQLLELGQTAAPDRLKGALLGAAFDEPTATEPTRSRLGLLMAGGGAMGAATAAAFLFSSPLSAAAIGHVGSSLGQLAPPSGSVAPVMPYPAPSIRLGETSPVRLVGKTMAP